MSLSLDLSDIFLMVGFRLCIFWQEHPSNNAVFSLHPIRWHTISLCPITDEMQFDHLIKAKSSHLIYYKVFFPLLSN